MYEIEFHEISKGRKFRVNPTEIKFYADDLRSFLMDCMGDKFKDAGWDYYMSRVKQSKALRPKFKFWVKGKNVWVYPLGLRKYVAVLDVGIHYVCQHAFDILPREKWDEIYGSYEEFAIGKLYPLKGESLTVTNQDIQVGFNLSRSMIEGFKNSFVEWIKHRNKLREE